MKKIARIFLAITIALAGAAIIVFGILLTSQSNDWPTIGFAIASVLFGTITILGAWAIAKGERLRDVLEILFLGLP